MHTNASRRRCCNYNMSGCTYGKCSNPHFATFSLRGIVSNHRFGSALSANKPNKISPLIGAINCKFELRSNPSVLFVFRKNRNGFQYGVANNDKSFVCIFNSFWKRKKEQLIFILNKEWMRCQVESEINYFCSNQNAYFYSINRHLTNFELFHIIHAFAGAVRSHRAHVNWVFYFQWQKRVLERPRQFEVEKKSKQDNACVHVGCGWYPHLRKFRCCSLYKWHNPNNGHNIHTGFVYFLLEIACDYARLRFGTLTAFYLIYWNIFTKITLSLRRITLKVDVNHFIKKAN